MRSATVCRQRLRSGDGPGFGWKDVTVVKLGVSYDIADWTLRAGYSHASQPVPKAKPCSISSPGVVQDHVSLGATLAQGKAGELSVAYTPAFRTTVRGFRLDPRRAAPQDGGSSAAAMPTCIGRGHLGRRLGLKF
jgi:long-chain fatty acid transport protein